MKNVKGIIGVFTLMAAACAFAQVAAPQKPTLAIADVDATPALMQSIKKDGKESVFSRIAQSLGDEIAASLQGSNRFQIVARGDFDKLLKEQDFAQSGNVDVSDENAAQAGKIKGAQYLLVVTVTDFQDYSERAVFETLGKEAEKRILRFGVVAKRYSSTTGYLMDTFSYSMSSMDADEVLKNVYRSGNRNDALVSEITKISAKRIADGFADRVLPIRVLSARSGSATVNRGEGSELKVGDFVEFFATGNRLIDPDTREDLGFEEVYVGKGFVERMMPKYSQISLVEDRGVDVGGIARVVKKPE
jgi:hypothetical protein